MNETIVFVGLAAQSRRLRSQIERRLLAVLDHGAYVNGPEIGELERALCDFCGAADAIAVSSGTDALLMPLLARGIGPGDAVFVPSFTFTATAEVVMVVGAEPVFVDVDRRTMNIDPEDLRRRIAAVVVEGRLRPRAVIAVDLFGLPAPLAELETICDEQAMLLIDDAAQGFGGAIDERKIGAIAPLTATSFFPAKPLGAYGDGGAIMLRSPQEAEVLRSVREHGQGRERYQIVRLGINGRLDSMQAAVLLAKLEVFADELAARERLARHYDHELGDVLVTPARPPGCVSAWAQYTVQVDERDTVRSRLSAAGVPTAIYYPQPMHLQPAYRRFGGGEGSLPASEALSRAVLSLPMNPYQPDQHTERVCDAVRASVRG